MSTPSQTAVPTCPNPLGHPLNSTNTKCPKQTPKTVGQKDVSAGQKGCPMSHPYRGGFLWDSHPRGRAGAPQNVPAELRAHNPMNTTPERTTR